MEDVVLSVSDFVGLLNQTLEFAYPVVMVQGELANFRVSKNKWVYFDLKDDYSSVKFFGTIYSLPGPLEDGMMLQVRGNPRLHNLYGFSINVQTIQPVGEGSIKKAAALLEVKLAAEGLFDAERKRLVPYPPARIGLIASHESAAYHDFIKILNERWGGVEILLADVQVQGDLAPGQVVRALEHLNTHEDVDVIVITRGGGSAEDLGAFSTEQVTRAVAASRTPTVVAIGHEVDISLAELAADQRASTPSNAAELLVPDKNNEIRRFDILLETLHSSFGKLITMSGKALDEYSEDLFKHTSRVITAAKQTIYLNAKLLLALDPKLPLRRGYVLVRHKGKIALSSQQIRAKDKVDLIFHDGNRAATVDK